MPLTEPTRLVLAKTYVGVDDPDAAAYIASVEAADEAASPGVGALETATKVAIHSFVKGCKADGIWPAIKASCILAGARTLAGALVPLVGTAPTNFNFVVGDYNRKTGLVGDGSTKYLDSNRNNNADPQDSFHASVYQTLGVSELKFILGAGAGSSLGRSGIVANNDPYTPGINFRARTNTVDIDGKGSDSWLSQGLIGMSRTSSSNTNWKVGVSSGATSVVSQAPLNASIGVFANDAGSSPTSRRLAFYSIGESLDLALLDARVTDLINAFGAAIP